MSVIVLGLAVLSLIEILYELFFGELSRELQNAAASAEPFGNIVLITQIFIAVVSLLLLLPQFYVGIKGLKVAKYPDTSVAHIVWAIILAVFTAIGFLSPIMDLIQGGDVLAGVATLLSMAVDFAVLVEYVKFAKAVRAGR